MESESALLDAIRHAANPAQARTTRLVYADWLDDRGDPRAEFIRINCQLDVEDRHPPSNACQALRDKEFKLAGEIDDRPWLWRVALPRLVETDFQVDTFDDGASCYSRLFNPAGSLSVAETTAEHGHALRLNGLPILYNFHVNSGTVDQIFSATRHRCDFTSELAQIRSVAERGLKPAVPIAQQVWPLVRCLETSLVFVQSPHMEPFERMEGEHGWYYPHGTELIPCQPTHTLDSDRIAFWRERLDDRPIVFVIGLHWASIVIDGHHKLEAYRQARRDANILRIHVKSLVTWATPESTAEFLESASEQQREAHRRSWR